MIILKITRGSYWSKFIRFQEFGIRVNEALIIYNYTTQSASLIDTTQKN